MHRLWGGNYNTTFSMNYSLFKLLVIFFGIINSLVIFQTIMNNIFQNLIAKEIIIVYLNNILIFTQILEDNCKIIYRVLEVLAKYKLFLYSKKYEFNKWQIEYLRLVISKDQVMIDSTKIASVCNWPTLSRI